MRYIIYEVQITCMQFFMVVHDQDAREEPQCGLVNNYGGDYDSVIGYSTQVPRVVALRLQPNQPTLHGVTTTASDLTTYPLLD